MHPAAAAWSLSTLLSSSLFRTEPLLGFRWGLRTGASPAGPAQMSCCYQVPARLCSELSPEPRGSCCPPPGHPRPSATGPHGNRGPSITPRVHLLSGPRCPPLSDHELLFVERKEASETGEWAPRSLGRCPAGHLHHLSLQSRDLGSLLSAAPLPAPVWRAQ